MEIQSCNPDLKETITHSTCDRGYVSLLSFYLLLIYSPLSPSPSQKLSAPQSPSPAASTPFSLPLSATMTLYEVKSGETLEVNVDEGKLVTLKKAKLGTETDETVFVKVSVDGGVTQLVAARLNLPSWPHKALDIIFDKDFQFSHTGSNTSVMASLGDGQKFGVVDPLTNLHVCSVITVCKSDDDSDDDDEDKKTLEKEEGKVEGASPACSGRAHVCEFCKREFLDK
ncbi:unnamed protein product [Lactuca virosa]|uniref:Uncharacterized protein n=1 Tax=Lactuca virosa TaxID=75947 RepID=A0AAU9PAJ8_9ASTR|nr:unnamed protein product [Lactuca virosa]